MRKYRILLVGGIIVSEIVWYLYKRFSNARNRATSIESNANVSKLKQDVTEVMFFSKDSSVCRIHNITREDTCVRNTCSVRYIRKLENYINDAKQSLDVCMYVLTCQSLSRAIVNAHKRGVLVRVIMDRSMVCNDAVQTSLFHNNGVAIRLQQPDDVLMHHKFAIVDGDIVITGSTNWTMSAFFGNFDNAIVTNHRLLVKPFVEEFERLWILFESSAYTRFEKNMA